MSRLLAVLLFIALLLALMPGVAFAAEPRTGDTVTVGPNEVIADDLYAFAGTVNVQGTVRGDVVAFGGNVTISGSVTGSVFAAGGTTTISGEVGGSVRAAGGNLILSGPVGGDVLVGGGNLEIGPRASVGRDLLAATGTTRMDGQVGRNMLVNAGDLTINGPVGGYVQARGDRIRVTDNATVGGNFTYTSSREAEISPGASIRGTVERHEPERRAQPGPAAVAFDIFIGWLRTLVGLFVFGLLFVLLFPSFSRDAVEAIRSAPWWSLGIGFVLLIIVPIAALVVLIAGIFLGGWWIGLVALAIYLIALALGIVVAGLFIGRWVLGRFGRPDLHFAWALLVGLVILTLVSLIPFVGGLVMFFAVLFGLGALAVAGVRARGSAM